MQELSEVGKRRLKTFIELMVVFAILCCSTGIIFFVISAGWFLWRR